MFYTFSVIFTGAVCILVLVITLFNIYLYLRRRFPIKVNCWFCNSWTRVEYDNQNSFECPTCLQYNGFAKDGSYNRLIPEQYDEHLNQKSVYVQKRLSPLKNSPNQRLCPTCNYNQCLKVTQLANFEPLVEKNYDVEVEHFQKQLEKAYGLCKRCDNVLEKLLQTQKLNIFGNRIRQLQRETASLFDLNKPYKGTKKIPIFIKFVYYFMILFAVLLLINAIATFDYSDGHLKKILPHFLFYIIRKTKLILNTLVKGTEDLQMEMYPLFQSMSEHCSNLSEEMEKITTDLWNTVSEQHVIKHCLQTAAEKINKFSLIQRNENHLINCALTATSGLLLQLILSFWSKNRGLTKVSQIMSWAVLILMSLNRLNGKYELLQLLLKIFCPLFIICTTSAEASLERVDTQNKKKLKKRKNIRKLIKEDDVFSDLSDCEKFTETNSSSSNKEKTVQLKCDTSNATARADCTTPHNNLETELNTSLSNLDLGSKHRGFNSNSSKPLLSPSKLNNVTKNPWTAGGFWSNPYSYSPLEPAPCNLSRSSSHSSGFGSHTNENVNFNSLPASPGNSVSGGDDHHSVFSEPPYHLGNGQFELYKSGNATIATSFYSPNSRNFGVHNPFQREVVWSSYGRGANSFAYASSAINLNLPHRNGYVVGSVFKNLSDPVKIQF